MKCGTGKSKTQAIICFVIDGVHVCYIDNRSYKSNDRETDKQLFLRKYAIKIKRTGTDTQTNFRVRVPRFLGRAPHL